MFSARQLRFVVVKDYGDVIVAGDVLSQAQVSNRRDVSGPSAVCLEIAVGDVALVALEGVLRLGRRLPLIAPDHVETGAIESEMKASDSREELRGCWSAAGLTTGHGIV